jgi:hypothetical protein
MKARWHFCKNVLNETGPALAWCTFHNPKTMKPAGRNLRVVFGCEKIGLGKTEWDLGGWKPTPELKSLIREMTELECPDTGPVLKPREYATEEEVKNALERAERVLPEHKERLKAPAPDVQRVRELAQMRHAQKAEEAKQETQRAMTRQARENIAIEEFKNWKPPDNNWHM